MECWDCGKVFNHKSYLMKDYGDFKVWQCPWCRRLLIDPSTGFGKRIYADIRGEAIANVSYLIDRYYKELKEIENL